MNGNGHTGLAIDHSVDPAARRAAPTKTPAEQKLHGVVTKAYAKFKEHRQPFEKTWFINSAMLMSQQYFIWNDHTRTFDIAVRSANEGIRLTINTLQGWWRRGVANLTARNPGMVVPPATTDQDDIEIARLGTKVVEGEFARLKIGKVLAKRIVGWQLATGNCFYEVKWDPQAGPLMWDEQPVMVPDPITGEEAQALNPDTGEPLFEKVPLLDDKGKQLHAGANVVIIRSPFEGGPAPGDHSGNDAPYWIWKSVRSIEWIRDNYGDIANLVKPDEKLQANSLYEKQQRQIVGVYGNTEDPTDSGAQELFPKSAEVIEYWEKPCGKYPHGRLIVIAGDIILFNGENPNTKQIENGINFPFGHVVEILVNGRCLGTSTAEHVGPLMRAYNRRRSQQEENAAVTGRPKVLQPNGSVIEGSFNSKAGEKITYRPGPRGEKPEYMTPPSSAQINDSAIIATQRDIQDQMSEHDVTKGIMPSANAPAEALKMLKEADDAVKGETEGHLRDGYELMGKMLLCNAAQYWTEERLVRVAGDIDMIAASRISGSQLEGTSGGDYFDVVMTPGSTTRQDPDKQREVASFYVNELKVLDPVMHRREIFQTVNDPRLDGVLKEDRMDESRANRENEQMERGEPVVASDYEGHNVHLQTLIRYMKSEKFLKLPAEIQMLFFQHKAEHEQFRLQEAQQQMMEQAAVQGAGMQPGGPGGQASGQPGAPQPGPEKEGETIDVERDPQSGQVARFHKKYNFKPQAAPPGEDQAA